jgi:hypothetical protein
MVDYHSDNHFNKKDLSELKPRGSCTPLFKEFKILTVPSIYILNSVMFRESHPEYYEYNENIHNYNTRNKSKLVVSKHFTKLVEKSPRYNTAKLFDSLPSCIRALNIDDLIKHLLGKILVYKMYYTVDWVDSFYN